MLPTTALSAECVATRHDSDCRLLETMYCGPHDDVLLLNEHLARLARSARALDYAFDANRIVYALHRGIRHARLSRRDEPLSALPQPLRLRLLLSRDGSVSFESQPTSCPAGATTAGEPPMVLPDPGRPGHGGVRIMLCPYAEDYARMQTVRHKTTCRSVYNRARQRAGLAGCAAFDVLLHNTMGQVTECSIANIALWTPTWNAWRTPSLECGLLPGVCREWLLRRGDVHEGIVTVDDALRPDARLVCFNAVRGVYEARLVPASGASESSPGIAIPLTDADRLAGRS